VGRCAALRLAPHSLSLYAMNNIWILLFVIYALYVLSEVIIFGYYLVTWPKDMIPPTLTSYFYDFGMLVVLIGFFGFITSRKILTKVFWRVVLISMLFLEVLKVVVGLYNLGLSYFDVYVNVWWAVLLTTIGIPAYIAIYLYSFKREKIWI